MIKFIQAAQEHAGAIGAGATGGFGLVGFAAKAIPVLQALSLCMTVLVGVATIAWYGYQAYHLKREKP